MTIVATRSGKVEGFERDGVHVFRGIPYAEPPIGALRWQAPRRAMHRAWIAFARNGDPQHDGLPTWPQYDLHRRATMRFDASCEVVDDPAREDRVAFEGVIV